MVEQNTVMVFIQNPANEILLYRRINTWYELNKLALPGGLVDAGESPNFAALREVREETSLVVRERDLTFITSVEAPHEETLYITHYFLATKFTGIATNTEPDRCGELIWCPLVNLPADTIPIIKTIAQAYVTPR